MTIIDIRTLTERERESLLLESYLEVEEEQARLGTLPRKRTVIGLLRPALKYVGALQIGLLVSVFTMFIVFVITRMMFHLDMSRYFFG